MALTIVLITCISIHIHEKHYIFKKKLGNYPQTTVIDKSYYFNITALMSVDELCHQNDTNSGNQDLSSRSM